MSAADTAPAEPVDLDTSALTPGHAAFVESMAGYCATLIAIDTPESLEANKALVAAIETLSAAFRLASAAMAAATPPVQ